MRREHLPALMTPAATSPRSIFLRLNGRIPLRTMTKCFRLFLIRSRKASLLLSREIWILELRSPRVRQRVQATERMALAAEQAMCRFTSTTSSRSAGGPVSFLLQRSSALFSAFHSPVSYFLSLGIFQNGDQLKDICLTTFEQPFGCSGGLPTTTPTPTADWDTGSGYMPCLVASASSAYS